MLCHPKNILETQRSSTWVVLAVQYINSFTPKPLKPIAAVPRSQQKQNPFCLVSLLLYLLASYFPLLSPENHNQKVGIRAIWWLTGERNQRWLRMRMRTASTLNLFSPLRNCRRSKMSLKRFFNLISPYLKLCV